MTKKLYKVTMRFLVETVVEVEARNEKEAEQIALVSQDDAQDSDYQYYDCLSVEELEEEA